MTKAKPLFLPALLPVSLLFVLVGGLIYYLDSPSESYLRMTSIAVNAYYPSEDFVRMFGRPDVSTYKSGNKFGIATPWWIARLGDGDTIILNDARLNPSELRTSVAEHNVFIDLFGRARASTSGTLVLGNRRTAIAPTSGAHWIRIPLTPSDVPADGQFSVTYYASAKGDYLEIWGTLVDSEPYPTRPRLVDRLGREMPLVFGPSPIRGGRVTEENIREIANLDEAPGADAVWRVGWTTDLPNTKTGGIAITLLGVLGIGIFVVGNVLVYLPPHCWQKAVFAGAGLCASIYFVHACVENGALLRNNYLSTSQAKEFLVLHGEQSQEFLREHFNPPAPSFIVSRMVNDSHWGIFHFLVPDRTLGDHGVITDDCSYAFVAWNILNNNHVSYYFPPLGYPIFLSMAAEYFGLSLSWTTSVQAILYACSGIILALAALRFGLTATVALLIWLFWLFDTEGSKFTQITYTEILTFPLGAIIIYILVDTLASKELGSKSRINAIALALAIAVSIYVRDIFIVLAFPIVGLFLLACWDGFWKSCARGLLIVAIVITSWAPVSLLHYDRSFSQGLLSLTPIALEHVDLSSFGAANLPLWTDIYHLEVMKQWWPLRSLHNLVDFWLDPFTDWSGIPFEGQIFGSISYIVSRTLPYLVLFSGVTFPLNRSKIERRFIVGAFAFLATVTIFHAVSLLWVQGRLRAPYEPLLVILAGLGVSLLINIMSSSWSAFLKLKGRGVKGV